MDSSVQQTESRWARWNHEYWPWWLIYLPAIPLLLWHALRARSLVFFTNVDPAIEMSGFFGERKSEIYALLPEGSYPTTVLIGPKITPSEAGRRMQAAGLSFPIIVKPDIGERGEGIVRVNDPRELEMAITAVDHGLLLQELVPGPYEYGLFFARDPRTGKTKLLSITSKVFLSVIGNGRSTVEDLLHSTYRGRKQIERLRGYKADLLASVPVLKECVVVEPVGNHCRGTIFVDACHLITPSLQRSVEEIVGGVDGLYYGRFDVRAESGMALGEGRFTILELNGVSSEPGHIYDPSYTILRCWSELLRHLRHIPRISHQMRERGHEPTSLLAVVERCRVHFSGENSSPLRAYEDGSSRTPHQQLTKVRAN